MWCIRIQLATPGRPHVASELKWDAFTRRNWMYRNTRTRKISDTIAGGLLLVVGVLSSVVVHFIGDIFVGEVLAVAATPFLIFSGRRLRRRTLISVFALLSLWLLGQIVADAYNQSSLANQVRGMSAITFFAFEIAFFGILVGTNERRKAAFLTAYGVGSVVLTQFQPNVIGVASDSLAGKWKWSYSFGFTCIILLASSWLIAHRRSLVALILMLVTAGVDLFSNFRSAFLMLFVTIVLVFPILPEQIGRLRILPRRNGTPRVAVVVMLAMAGGWSANRLVHFVSGAALIDEKGREKNVEEAQAGNLLVGGRPEFFVGLRAAMDSPFIGHGAWARDMKYVEMQHDMMQEFGIDNDLADVEATAHGLIPSHSHIVGAWVSAGIFGALFWGYILWLVFKALATVAVSRPAFAPIQIWLLVGYIWSILFSPFGSTSRIIEAFTLVLIVDVLQGATITMPVASQWRRMGRDVFLRRPRLQVELAGRPAVNNPTADSA